MISGGGARNQPKPIWVVIQLCALSFHVPLTVVSGTQRTLADTTSAFKLGLAVSLASLLLYVLLKVVTKDGWKALAWTSVGLLFFWHWQWSSTSSIAATLVTIALLVLVLVAAGLYSHHLYLQVGLFAVSITLAVTMLVRFAISEFTAPPPVVSLAGAPAFGLMSSTPDIFLIVLDGYGREDVLRTIYAFDNSEFAISLENSGFNVASSANANYGGTHQSIPSLLNMTYVAEDGDVISNSDLEVLARSISGDNALVRTLKDNGYRYIHGDTDHWVNTCGREVDVCLEGPLLDITIDSLLAATPVGPLIFPSSGDPSTYLNLDRIEQLENWGQTQGASSSAPTFTYLHLMLPHPPLYLDSSCSVDIRPNMGERNLNLGDISTDVLAERKDGYIEQVKCANLTIERFLAQVDEDDVVVITADHGPDSYGLMTGNPSMWSAEQMWERFGTLTAVRLPACPIEDEDLQLVNVFRLVLGCLTGDGVLVLEKRYFGATYGGPVFEIPDPDSAELDLANN